MPPSAAFRCVLAADVEQGVCPIAIERGTVRRMRIDARREALGTPAAQGMALQELRAVGRRLLLETLEQCRSRPGEIGRYSRQLPVKRMARSSPAAAQSLCLSIFPRSPSGTRLRWNRRIGKWAAVPG